MSRAEADNTPRRLLTGIRVLDLTRVLAGPYATQLLGDLGADIIKIEDTATGDVVRSIAPRYEHGESHYFLSLNRNKKSVCVDLKTAEGRELLLDLARHCDVVIENFRPGVMDRLGIGFEQLRAVKPDIILCSISGYGAEGPLSGTPAFDLVIQARSGAMSVNGDKDGPPTKLGLPVGDLGGAVWSSIAILSCLLARPTQPEAKHIDVSLYDGVLAFHGYLTQLAFLTGTAPSRVGTDHHNVAPYGRFAVKDGYIVIADLSGTFWERLCHILGLDRLIDDPRFATNDARVARRDELQAIMADVLLTKTRAEWSQIFLESDVPAGPVNDILEALDEGQVTARGTIRQFVHPTEGTVDVVGPPLRVNGQTTAPVLAPPPLLGEHTRSVLRELLDLAPDQIERMIDRGVIRVAE